jgi:hypothetical protein
MRPDGIALPRINRGPGRMTPRRARSSRYGSMSSSGTHSATAKCRSSLFGSQRSPSSRTASQGAVACPAPGIARSAHTAVRLPHIANSGVDPTHDIGRSLGTLVFDQHLDAWASALSTASRRRACQRYVGTMTLTRGVVIPDRHGGRNPFRQSRPRRSASRATAVTGSDERLPGSLSRTQYNQRGQIRSCTTLLASGQSRYAARCRRSVQYSSQRRSHFACRAAQITASRETRRISRVVAGGQQSPRRANQPSMVFCHRISTAGRRLWPASCIR